MQSTSKSARCHVWTGGEHWGSIPRKKDGKARMHRRNRRHVNKHINEYFD